MSCRLGIYQDILIMLRILKYKLCNKPRNVTNFKFPAIPFERWNIYPRDMQAVQTATLESLNYLLGNVS